MAWMGALGRDQRWARSDSPLTEQVVAMRVYCPHHEFILDHDLKIEYYILFKGLTTHHA